METRPHDPTLRFQGEHWSVAVFSAREDANCLTAVVLAAADSARAGATLHLDVLVNGNPTLAGEMHARLSTGHWWKHGTTIRLWSIGRGDKAHVWNHYLHTMMPDADVSFFMDGYVEVECKRRAERRVVAVELSREPEAALSQTPCRGTRQCVQVPVQSALREEAATQARSRSSRGRHRRRR
ncbi:MAG: hypothetical protein ACXWVT_07420, partial [Burkholderiaceae bacterium]